MYLKPLYSFPFDLRSPDFDAREMIYAHSDVDKYNWLLGNAVSNQDGKYMRASSSAR
jgi:hypothetical protein